MFLKVLFLVFILFFFSCSSTNEIPTNKSLFESTENPTHTHIVFSEHFEGITTVFISKNNKNIMIDTIFVDESIELTSAIISNYYSLNGVKYRHYWKKYNDSLIEIPEYPKSNKGYSISTQITGSYDDFPMFRVRLSNILKDTFYLRNGYDEFLIEKKYDEKIFNFVDSILNINIIPGR
jgi:hypothetical protein